MPQHPTKRMFVAAPLDDVLREEIVELTETIAIDGLRLIPAENLHVTLKFLGDVDDPLVPGVIEAIGEAVGDLKRFDLAATAVEYLPSARRPRVMAVALEDAEAMQWLFECVEEAVGALGFPLEGRRYHPHITIGRFNVRKGPPRDVPAAQTYDPPPGGCVVDRVAVMQSVLGRGAPTYTAMETFTLGA